MNPYNAGNGGPASSMMSSLSANTQSKLIDRIAALESQLAEAERTIAAMQALANLLEDERDEARRVAVRSAREATRGFLSVWVRGVSKNRERCGHDEVFEHDGTDADIYRALKEASGIGEGER